MTSPRFIDKFGHVGTFHDYGSHPRFHMFSWSLARIREMRRENHFFLGMPLESIATCADPCALVQMKRGIRSISSMGSGISRLLRGSPQEQVNYQETNSSYRDVAFGNFLPKWGIVNSLIGVFALYWGWGSLRDNRHILLSLVAFFGGC